MRLRRLTRQGRRGSPSSSETHFSDISPIVAGALQALARCTGLLSLLAHLLIQPKKCNSVQKFQVIAHLEDNGTIKVRVVFI